MRYIVSAGHGGRDPGAVNEDLGLFEHLEAYRIAWHLRTELEALGHTAEFISCFQSLGDKIRQVNWLHEVKPVALALEIHFNSAEAPTANGTECLYYSTKNEPLAAKLSLALSAALGTNNRGSKKRDNLGWLKRTDPPAVIVEVLFLNNDAEAALIQQKDFHRRVAKAIAEGLAT